MEIKYVKGDLIELAKKGEFEVIIHCCNCFNTMGAGIAKTIRDEFPEAYLKDKNTIKGDRSKLGTYNSVTIKKYPKPFFVINLYGQYDFKVGNGPNINYVSLAEGLLQIKKDFTGLKFGLPRIGAGLAGGSWTVIEAILLATLKDEDVTVVDYQPIAKEVNE